VFILLAFAKMRIRAVGRYFARGSLRQRVVALAAAYLIALAGLLASFGTANAAAADIANSNSSGFICHTAAGGPSSPTDDQSKDTICAECCGVGCLMLMAALPPPPATAAPLPQASSDSVAALAAAPLTAAPVTKSHRSRAPPYGA
jgi:hypothetical protein